MLDAGFPWGIAAAHIMSDDDRKHLRYPITGRARITLPPGSQVITVTLLDIGEGGVSVLCDYAIKPGTRCQLAFNVADADGRRDIDAPIIVRNGILSRGQQRLGLQFLALPADMRERIETVVARRCSIMTGR